jgi:hypothetical protein
MKTYGGAEVDPPFFTSALNGGELSASRPGPFTPGTHCIGGRVGLKAGLDAEEKILLPLTGIEPLGSSP